MSATREQRILMAGCGRLGQRIGLALAENHRVYGLRRRADKVPLPMTGIAGDLYDPDTLTSLPQVDLVIVCLTPDQYDDAGYQAIYGTGLNNLMAALQGQSPPPERILFVSSTAVYAQDNDEWVNEDSATLPRRYNGIRVLEAEKRLRDGPLPATILRLSGIYGHERRQLVDAIRAGKVAPNAHSGYTNRVHEDDAVGAICHLVTHVWPRGDLADCYLVSDCEPARIGNIAAWVREMTHCAPVQEDARKDSRVGSKRCSNQRLLETGYRFLYPSFREGYEGLL